MYIIMFGLTRICSNKLHAMLSQCFYLFIWKNFFSIRNIKMTRVFLHVTFTCFFNRILKIEIDYLNK
jgi:hypothetical protein